MITRVGLSSKKVVTVRNGTDILVFRPPTAQESQTARQRLGLPRTLPIVGAAGRLIDWKRLDLFLEAVAEILKAGREAHFVVVGDGPLHESLANLATQLGVRSNVHFLGWRSDMNSIYHAMDVFCLTSDSGDKPFRTACGEGFGLVSIEAMASGLPVVAVDTNVNRQIVTEECGLLCKAEADDLAGKINRLLDDARMRRRHGNGGRLRVVHHFNIDSTAGQLSEIYSRGAEELLPPKYASAGA